MLAVLFRGKAGLCTVDKKIRGSLCSQITTHSLKNPEHIARIQITYYVWKNDSLLEELQLKNNNTKSYLSIYAQTEIGKGNS
jgi:hypothetical protein